MPVLPPLRGEDEAVEERVHAPSASSNGVVKPEASERGKQDPEFRQSQKKTHAGRGERAQRKPEPLHRLTPTPSGSIAAVTVALKVDRRSSRKGARVAAGALRKTAAERLRTYS